jgi:membrane protease YdiL (CAAX protease family)
MARSIGLTRNLWDGIYVACALIDLQLAVLWRPIVGVYVVAAALVSLLGLALWTERVRKLAISAAILPVALTVGFALPLTSGFARICILYGTILLLTLMSEYLFSRGESAATPDRRRSQLLTVPAGVLIGGVIGASGYMLFRGQYYFGGTAFPVAAIAAVAFAITEELFFRGLIQRQAGKLMHPAAAILLTVIAYTCMSVGHGGVTTAFFAVASSFELCVLYELRHNLLLNSAANIAMKLSYLYLVFRFVLG